MNDWFLIGGAVLSLVGMIFHGVVGGRVYMGNVNDSSMEALTKSLSLVSWHVFTIFLLVSALTLGYAAYDSNFTGAVLPIIGVNSLGAALFIALGLGNHSVLLKMPGAYLMGGTALLAWLGVQ
jgi:hypothetical protein